MQDLPRRSSYQDRTYTILGTELQKRAGEDNFLFLAAIPKFGSHTCKFESRTIKVKKLITRKPVGERLPDPARTRQDPRESKPTERWLDESPKIIETNNF